MLEAFMRLLIDGGVVGTGPPADADQKLDEVWKINRCVIIAGRLGLEHGHVFDKLCAGPYSEELCGRIEELAPQVRAGLDREAPPLPARFDRDRFLRLLAGKDDVWIEVAARLIINSHARPDVESLAEWYGDLPMGRSPELCSSIIREMTSPEIGIVLDCDKCLYDEPWRPLLASATHYPAAARPVPAAAG